MKEMNIAMQTTCVDGRWRITIQSWVESTESADTLIKIIEIIKPLLAENITPDRPSP